MPDSFIEIIPETLSIEECNLIIDLCKDKLPYAATSKKEEFYNTIRKVDQDRRKDISIFPSSFGSLAPVMKILKNAIETNRSKYHPKKNLLEYTRDSEFKIQVSYAGGGFCDWHTEQNKGEKYATRFMVWMFYLNTVEQGGKTEFKYFESVKPTAGTLVYWPASYSHVHRAAPDLKEEKWIATGWFKYPMI